MLDVHMRDVPRGPLIAIGAAGVALVISLVAVIVVVSRDGSSSSSAQPTSSRVPAAEVAKLKREAVEAVSAGGKVIGVKVTDDKLRVALGLEPDDVITSLAGREIKREFDAFDAVLGALQMNASIIYVDVMRGGKPAILRWQLDGDVRAARRAAGDPRPDGAGVNPLLGDPLLDSIKKIDEYHYEIPRSTIDRIIANPNDHAKSARIVPTLGTPSGFKLYAIRPSSVWSAIGFQNGDTIRAVNGFEMNSVDNVLEVYTRVKDAKELAIDITRSGKYELITITIK